ncbi:MULTISPECIES: LexA family transcriptional regulator [Snodgrassella]|uniref:XRE family transcriptional regulator n=1 Tax=Snodgrassella TaxID=1193515 RepID=UPI0022698262|nr:MULTISPECIES: LexA family transcriptional regulator [unclassified Snodgrassella]MCX8748048.1 LexA family transcriptional regulator [Snodgrassella sp. B3088]MCX8752910.1 LexA family transcriptional regulator [Snodgrassella sp. B3837]
MKFAIQLKAARLAAGLSQKELAFKTGITPSLISRYELGKVAPRLETVNRIMQILNFQPSESISEGLFNDDAFIPIPPLPSQNTHSETSQLNLYREDIKLNNLQVDNLVSITMSGDSMHTLLNDGDKLVVDVSKKIPVDGKIYAFNQGSLLRIRILQNLPNERVRMKSYNNHEYPDETVGLNQIEIIGQIVYKAGFI